MIIGIDADGVLTDMAGFNYKYGEKFWKRAPVNPDEYKTGDIFDVSHFQEVLFGIRYFYEYCVKLPPRENAADVIRRLSAEGHSLYEITARKYAVKNSPLGRLSRRLFRKWLAENGLCFKDIFFCTEENTPSEKLDACRKISADIMIDDKPDVAVHLAENGVAVLLFDAPYNKGVSHENITRVYDWDGIYELISEGLPRK